VGRMRKTCGALGRVLATSYGCAKSFLYKASIGSNEEEAAFLAYAAVTATVVTAASSTLGPTTIAVFALAQAITFIAPWMRITVEAEAVAPLPRAVTVTAVASTAGAAWTEFAEI